MSPFCRLCPLPRRTGNIQPTQQFPIQLMGGQLCPAVDFAQEVRYESNLQHYRKADR